MSVGGGGKRSSGGVSARRGKMVGRSKVWRLASFVDERRSEVECSLCPVRIKYVGNTTNIARHLELRHPLEFAALDPSNGGAGRGPGLGRQHPHRQQQQNREEAAICRILAQHREELKKQSTSVSDEQRQPAAASSCFVPAQRWTWHTPVQGAQASEDRSGSEFSHHNSDDAPIPVSPDHFLPEGNDQDEPTPVPPTPIQHQKPESYQLRHNNHLTIVLEALARDESFMDVTLSAQGRSLKAHKSVLSAVSTYFRGVLRDNPCQHPIIIMPRDVRFEELYSIVSYIYKGEMTVAAEDLTSLLKTAEILQVSGLAPSDSSATVNPHTDTLHVRSSSNSSSSVSSASNIPPVSRPSKPMKIPTQTQATPPARPKSTENIINPADFIDVDMTCVKEEVLSEGEEEKDDPTSEQQCSQPPEGTPQAAHCSQSPECPQPTGAEAKDDDGVASDQVIFGFSSPDETFEQPVPSTSSHEAEFPSLGVKSDPEKGFSSQAPQPVGSPQPLQCPHCDEQYRDVESIDSHLRIKHPTKPSFTCKCGRIFTRQIHHQAHARMCSSSS